MHIHALLFECLAASAKQSRHAICDFWNFLSYCGVYVSHSALGRTMKCLMGIFYRFYRQFSFFRHGMSGSRPPPP